MKMNWKKLYVTFMIALLSAFFVPAAAFADTTSEEVTNESTEEVASEDTEQPEDVIANPILELKTKTIYLQKGKSFAATKLIKKMAEGDEVISWKSSKTKHATVSSKGIIKAKKPGTTKITITLKSGKSARITVKVQKSAVKTTSIRLNKKKVSLKKNQTYTLKVTRAPYTTFDKITYTSSNPSVAKVSAKGKIKAVKPGTAKITVKSGKKKAVCAVTVKKTPLSQKQVYKDIMALKKKYPEGKKWTNDNYYEWKGGIYRGGYGCARASLPSE